MHEPAQHSFFGITPADLATSRRLKDQHDVTIDAVGGKLALCPVSTQSVGFRVLESGTADGHWLFDLAGTDPPPDSMYVGTDINSKFFPVKHGPHFKFYAHNMADPWPIEEQGAYDLVHQRLSLPGAAPATTLPTAIHNLFSLVKPGGWIQLVEAEQQCPNSGPAFRQCVDLVREVFDKTGAGWTYAKDLRQWLEAEGAINVQELYADVRFGAANAKESLREISATSTAQAFAVLAHHAKALNVSAGMSEQEINSLGDRTLAELLELGAHYPLRAVWGQKRVESQS